MTYKGKKYRKLDVGEVVKVGDLFRICKEDSLTLCETMVGNTINEHNGFYYYRPIKPKKARKR